MTPHDALDPGPLDKDGKPTYPHWPREPDGSRRREGMVGPAKHRRKSDGRVFDLDLTPHDSHGEPQVPPDIDD